MTPVPLPYLERRKRDVISITAIAICTRCGEADNRAVTNKSGKYQCPHCHKEARIKWDIDKDGVITAIADFDDV